MRRLGSFALPIALMGLIYFLSAQPDLSSGIEGWDTPLRKAAHMTEFGLLWFLWLRAVGGERGPWIALAIVLVWAATDEWHQTFVQGRHGSPWDWAIDAAGVGIAAAIWVRFQLRARDRARGGAGRPAVGPPAGSS